MNNIALFVKAILGLSTVSGIYSFSQDQTTVFIISIIAFVVSAATLVTAPIIQWSLLRKKVRKNFDAWVDIRNNTDELWHVHRQNGGITREQIRETREAIAKCTKRNFKYNISKIDEFRKKASSDAEVTLQN